MEDFANELAAWQTPQKSEPASMDASDLAKEYQSVFEAQHRSDREKQDLIRGAEGIFSQFRGAFDRVASQISQVTRLQVEDGVPHDLPPYVQFAEYFGSPSVIWRGAQHIQAQTTIDSFHHVRLRTFLQIEAFDNNQVRMVSGHQVLYEVGASREVAEDQLPWNRETTGVMGSASFENDLAQIHREMQESAKAAIQQFAEQVKAVRG
jgi:hypothetical protein